MRQNNKRPKRATILPITVRSILECGNVVRRLRKLQGLSQAELASKAGTTQATISRLENAQQNTETATLILVLAALGAELAINEAPRIDTIDSLEGLT